MRIRTDGEYEHREDTIKQAAEEFDCNKTRAILLSCEVAADVLPALETALDEADIRPSEKQKIVDEISSHRVSVNIEPDTVTVEPE